MKTELDLDYQFWMNYYPEDGDYFSWASNKAYLDMNRTMTFRESTDNLGEKVKKKIEGKRKGWRNEVTDIIREQFRKELAKAGVSYDDWHQTLCNSICNSYNNYGENPDSSRLVQKVGKRRTEDPAQLTFGQAQKWLNMTMKYLWLLGRLGGLSKTDQDIMDNIEDNLHVPLDSYIIKYIRKEKKGRETVVSDNGLGAITTDLQPEWSRIDDKDVYYIEVEGSFASWKKWAVKAGINRKVLGYLSFRNDRLYGFDATNDDLAFPTPRSWEMVSNILNTVSENEAKMHPMIAGLVGMGTAIEFRTWCKVYHDLPDVEEIFGGTAEKIPKGTDALYALVSSITAYASEHRTDAVAIGHSLTYASQLPADFGELLIQNYRDS